MYLYSNKKSLHVRGSIGSRTWFHRFMYVIPWVHIRGPNVSRTWNGNMHHTKYISQALSA